MGWRSEEKYSVCVRDAEELTKVLQSEGLLYRYWISPYDYLYPTDVTIYKDNYSFGKSNVKHYESVTAYLKRGDKVEATTEVSVDILSEVEWLDQRCKALAEAMGEYIENDLLVPKRILRELKKHNESRNSLIREDKCNEDY